MAPLLQVGMQRQYTGTTTRSVVYASPTTTNENNTLVYTFTENQSVEQAPAGSSADSAAAVSTEMSFDMNRQPRLLF